MANNGGGNPNHDAEGKFTSSGESSTSKSASDPLMDLFGSLMRIANNLYPKKPSPTEQKIKDMGFSE